MKKIFKSLINIPFSLFDTYKLLFFSTLAVITLLIVLTLLLLTYIRRIRKMRKKLVSNDSVLTSLYGEIAATKDEFALKYNELKETKKNLAESVEMYALVMDATNVGIWDWDIKTDSLFLSDRWYKMLGYDKVFFNKNMSSLESIIHEDDRDLKKIALLHHIQNKTDQYESEFRIKAMDGEYHWIKSRGKALFDENDEFYRMTGSHIDISEIKEYQNKLQYTAYHDQLTGRYNRLYIFEKVGYYLSKLAIKDTVGAMLFVDIDNFKFVNDTMGHNFGDRLIKEISDRLFSFTNNNCILARIGEDEFIFYIKDAKTKEYTEEFVKKILNGFNEPFNLENNLFNFTVSIGVSMFPMDGSGVDQLLTCAEIAMYKVKNRGRDGYYFFNNIIKSELQDRVNMERYLKRGLVNDEFLIYYQPQINSKTKEIEGFEALVRWISPELGFMNPIKFIHIAEETGFIVQLGEWVLHTSCKYINELNLKNNREYTISVNISVIQLLQDKFCEMVSKVLAETGLPERLLELEVTESMIMDSPDLIIKKLQYCRDMGIGIALDDFGTGYSSLAYLRDIPITTLKIDKLFIDDICDAGKEHTITNTIISLGNNLGLTIVAEGVETKEQLEYLEKNDCDKIQGYYFSKPLPKEELEKIL